MKTKTIFFSMAACMSLWPVEDADVQIGETYIHEPSTIMEWDGKYDAFGTGGGGLIAEDGWTWKGGGSQTGKRCRTRCCEDW